MPGFSRRDGAEESYYSDDPEEALISRREDSRSSKKKKSRKRDYDEDSDSENSGGGKAKGSSGGCNGVSIKTFLIGVVFFAFTAALCGVLLKINFWLAMGSCLIWLAVMPSIATTVFESSYHAYTPKVRPEKAEWRYTLRQTVMLGVIFACVIGVWGGYYFREYDVAVKGKSYKDVSVDDPAKENPGQLIFSGGAKPNIARAAKVKALGGLIYTCVAPIQAGGGSARYFAVEAGTCCATGFDCPNWHTTEGGIFLKYTELYPEAHAAIRDAVKTHTLTHADAPVLLRWGKPSTQVTELKRNFGLIAGLCGAAGLVIMFLRAFVGPY